MKYYYNKDGVNHGPVTIEELCALAEQGEIQKQTPVIEKGKKEWMRWRALEEMYMSGGRVGDPVNQPARKAPEPIKDTPALAEKLAFVSKITRVYDKIDGACEKLCRGGYVNSPELYKQNLSLLNGLVGVGTLLCILCYCSANGVYQNVGIFLAVLAGGAVVQYISYQMYCAMLPLLFGSKIKLSSMWLPRILAFACVPLILACVFGAFAGGGAVWFLTMLGGLFTLAGVGYYCLNCTNLSVKICQDDVVPGRELINLVRFLVRVVFTTLHVLTPVYMLLTSLILLIGEKKEMMTAGNLLDMFSDMRAMPVTLAVAVLPIILLPLFYICSFIPDFVESFFTRSDNKS